MLLGRIFILHHDLFHFWRFVFWYNLYIKHSSSQILSSILRLTIKKKAPSSPVLIRNVLEIDKLIAIFVFRDRIRPLNLFSSPMKSSHSIHVVASSTCSNCLHIKSFLSRIFSVECYCKGILRL